MNKPNSKFIIYSLLVIIIAITLLIIFNKNSNKTPIVIAVNNLDIVYGSDSAPLTVFLYSSYSCVFCRKFFNEAYPTLKKEYIDTKKIRLVVKLIELTNDKRMFNGLKTAVCINKYGNFDKLDKLLLTEPKVVYTKEFDMVVEEFIEKDIFIAECMISGEAENYLLKNKSDFKNNNLTGTPTYIINNTVYRGYKNYKHLKKIIEKELNNTLQ